MFKTNDIIINLELLFGYNIDDLSDFLKNIENFKELIPYCTDIELINKISESDKNIKFWFEIFFFKRFILFKTIFSENTLQLISNNKKTFKKFNCNFKLKKENDNLTKIIIDLDFHSIGYMINSILYKNRVLITNNIINTIKNNLFELIGEPNQEMQILVKNIN